jgi:hypothetical protein
MRTKQRERALCRLLERSGIQPIDASTRPGYFLGRYRLSEQGGDLQSPVQGVRRNNADDRGRPQARFLLRKANCGTERGQPKGLLLMRYRWFESISLQRRVCEPSVLLRLSCRRLRLATPRGAFRRSGTDGSNPVPSFWARACDPGTLRSPR